MQVGVVDTIFFWVTDLDRSTAWYQHTLGLEPGSRYGDWQEITVAGPVRFALHGGAGPHGSVNAVVAFRVEGLDATIDELAAKGISPIDQPTDTGAARFVTLRDPDGNHVQLLERR